MAHSALLSSTLTFNELRPWLSRTPSHHGRTPRAVVLRVEAAAYGSDKKASWRKSKATEDGIFGISGGPGLTKQNELFMGRVAMLGFAAVLLGEALTGQGIISHMSCQTGVPIETGVPIAQAHPALLLLIVLSGLTAVGGLGDRGAFVGDEWSLSGAEHVRAVLGKEEQGPLFGFTKENELFVGRVAQLGFAGALLGEVQTGQGALSLLNISTGGPINELEPLLLLCIFFFSAAAITPGTGRFVTADEEGWRR